jgi:hypothetical protein
MAFRSALIVAIAERHGNVRFNTKFAFPRSQPVIEGMGDASYTLEAGSAEEVLVVRVRGVHGGDVHHRSGYRARYLESYALIRRGSIGGVRLVGGEGAP